MNAITITLAKGHAPIYYEDKSLVLFFFVLFVKECTVFVLLYPLCCNSYAAIFDPLSLIYQSSHSSFFSQSSTYRKSYSIMDPHITTLLLRQLLDTWYPDVKALAGRIPNVLSKTSKLETPTLISILARLADAPAKAHEPQGKELPCGHRVEATSILTHSNLFGDQVWGRRRQILVCPNPGCDTKYTLPMIPAPSAVDGLKARLDLIQWVWAYGKDAPNNVDVKIMRVLHRILDQIGHRPRSSEMSSSSLSERRLKQTLRLFESEGVAGAVAKTYAGPRFPRGKEPFCRFRRSKAPPPEYLRLRYLAPSPGQFCICEEPHWVRDPRAWISTPAEDEEKREFVVARIERSGKDRKSRQEKSVRFAAPVTTRIHYFKPWWRHEYRDSDRYYSSGPCRPSVDTSTKEDDEKEIERLNISRRGVSGWGIKDQKRIMMDNGRRENWGVSSMVRPVYERIRRDRGS